VKWRDGWRGQTSACSSSGLNAKAGEVEGKGKLEGEARRALVARLGCMRRQGGLRDG
jgi:hypothetical protein